MKFGCNSVVNSVTEFESVVILPTSDRGCSKNRTYAITLEWQVGFAWNFWKIFSVIQIFKISIQLGPIRSLSADFQRLKFYEFFWIMSKSNNFWWRHFRSIMMSSEVKLVWHSRFWAEISENSNRFEFKSSSFSLEVGIWGLLFNFQWRKNRSKIAQIQYLKSVFRQIHYAESREHISFFILFWSEDSQF